MNVIHFVIAHRPEMIWCQHLLTVTSHRCILFLLAFYHTHAHPLRNYLLMVASPPGILDNFIPKDVKDHLKEAGFSDLLLDGDLKALSDLLYSNLTEV